MKLRLLHFCLGLMLTLTARAGISYSSTSGSIPDGATVGWSATATASGYLPSISDVTVNLNISGGFNADLYAYLSYGGVLVPLLNRVGVQTSDAFGYGDTGFAITLSSAGAYDVHWYQTHTTSGDYNGSGQLTGTWRPDGRAIDPASSPSSFDAPGTVSFANFQGLNPNGTWTLFVADLSSGAQSSLVSWSMDITAVPEPVNVALVLFGGVFGLVTVARSRQVRNFLRRALAH
jgi:hypothetical protein